MPIPVSLHTLRTSRGWTQAQLARVIGVHPVTIHRWENGGAPNNGDLARIASVFVLGDAELGELARSFARNPPG